jgi:hypothetical protein
LAFLGERLNGRTVRSDIGGRRATRTSVRAHSIDIDYPIELMADRIDGATRAGMIVRDGSSCGQQGKPTLMATLRSATARSRHGAERLRVKIRRRLSSKLRAGGDGRRPRIAVIEAGFSILVVLTTWVIASVSAWWVPVYLILLVTIFVVPRRRRLLSSGPERVTASDARGIADFGVGLRVDCADAAEQFCPPGCSDSDLKSSEWAESSDANPDATPVGTSKLRKSRIRVRKTAPATEPVTVSIPVVWMRTGPGKFVRVEGGIQAAHSAEFENVSVQAYPVTDIPAEAINGVPVQTELPSEQNPPRSFGIFPGEVEQFCTWDNRASRSDTEEYGIAPAVFSLAPEFNASVERSAADPPVQVHQSEVEIAVRAEAGGELPPGSAKTGRRLRQPGVSGRWTGQVQRDLDRAVPDRGRVLRQRIIRYPPNPRSLVASRFAWNEPRRSASYRANGQIPHGQRALRTRSPPGRF